MWCVALERDMLMLLQMPEVNYFIHLLHCVRRAAALRITKNPLNPFFKSLLLSIRVPIVVI